MTEVAKEGKVLSVEDKISLVKEMRMERRKLMCAGNLV
jgi:hypothetical protein